jgi:hypothetical protein
MVRNNSLNALLISLLALPLTGCCTIFPTVCESRDTVESMLDKALAELHAQPGLWETTFTNLIKQLESSGSNLVVQVKGAYESMLGQTTGEFSCRVDFVGDRARQHLQAIAHNFNPQKYGEPTLSPIICSTTPQGPLKPGTEAEFVKFFGYDLKALGANGDYHAILRYSDGNEIVQDSVGFISIPHDYMIMLDLQAAQDAMSRMDRNRGPQLVLMWGDQVLQTDHNHESVLPIDVPCIPQPPSPHQRADAIGPFGDSSDGNWGDWYPLAMCPNGQWVTGGLVRIERSQGGDNDEDDTALNTLHLFCGPAEKWSGEGFWGDWEDMGRCKNGGHVKGARVRIEPKQGKGDDTGAVDLELVCEDDSVLKGSTHHEWGRWRGPLTCPTGTAVCGLETRIEAQQGSDHDDTAMNDVKFTCCTVTTPPSACE